MSVRERTVLMGRQFPLSAWPVVRVSPNGADFVALGANSRLQASLAPHWRRDSVAPIRELVLLAIHLLTTLARLLRSGGIRAVAAESLLRKPQILISNHSRRRAPNLSPLDSLALGLTTLVMRPHRIPRRSVILKPTTLLKFHKALVDRKYRLIISSSGRKR